MSLTSRLAALWRNLVNVERVERDLDEEVRAALELLVDEKVRNGMQVDDARRAAAIELGGLEAVKEQVRVVKAGANVDSLLQDVRYAVRTLRRAPMFALTAALSLAIGIGATTTIFTVANGLLLRTVPGVADPERLVEIVPAEKGRPMLGMPVIAYTDYVGIRHLTTTLTDVHGYELEVHPASMDGAAGAERVFAGIVTSNYFTALGVAAAAGRFFDVGDGEAEGDSPFVVLSHSFWTRYFAADLAIVGRQVRINGVTLTVRGVAAQEFRGMSVLAPDLWVPAAMSQVVQPGKYSLTNPRSTLQMALGARLRPNASPAQAAADLARVADTLTRTQPDSGRRAFAAVPSTPIPGNMRVVVAAFLALLMAIVSVLLVIACANVAGVLSARATSRRREIAVRAALGAKRARIVRQLLTETLLLFVVGGIAGVALARGMTTLLLSQLPAFPMPVYLSVPLDWRVLAFSLALSALTAVLTGITPALHAARSDVVSALKDESQGPVDRLRLRGAFVVVQVTFSVLLMVLAGLLGKALLETREIDRGFDANGIDIVSLELSAGGYTPESGPSFLQALHERVRALPGVAAATLTDRAPDGHAQLNGAMRMPGALEQNGEWAPADWRSVAPGYFGALQIPLVEGRDFSTADREDSQPVVILEETTARRLWPEGNPIGRSLEGSVTGGLLHVGGRPSAVAHGRVQRFVVVGVARAVSVGGPHSNPLVAYVPLQQRYTPHVTIITRTAGRSRIDPDVARVVASMNPRLAIMEAFRLADRTGPAEQRLRISVAVAGSVGFVGLLLAALGVYGVTAFAVAQRTREIGIRLALGAGRLTIIGDVMRRGMILIAAGSALGLLLSIGAVRLLSRSPIVGAGEFDPLSFGGAAIIFGLVGAIACYLPARRATRGEALSSLRAE